MNTAHGPSETVLAAWQDQLAGTAPQRSLAQAVVERGPEVLPRFAGFHGALRALPRGRRRTLQRQLGLTLATAALLLALGSEPAPAATITVDGTFCTLADAITAANTDASSGGCPAGNAADTLVLSPGSRHTLTSVNTDFHGPTGLPVIASEILIEGNGAVIERADNAPEFRILAVDAPGTLTLEQATITGGGGVNRGGGLYNYGGDVTIANSTVSGNSAMWPQGGGVFNGTDLASLDGVLAIAGSTISGNFGDGVSICAYYDYRKVETTITDSIISGNQGTGVTTRVSRGGGVTMIAGSTISDNMGFGIYDNGGYNSEVILTVTDSNISGNLYDGVQLTRGSAVDTGSTIARSSITNNAGIGVYLYSDESTLLHPFTITGNTIANNRRGFRAEVNNRVPMDIVIENSTISGNSITGRGGTAGVSVDAYLRDVSLGINIVNSTIAGNVSTSGVGGLSSTAFGRNAVLDLTVSDSTITDNSVVDGVGGVFLRDVSGLDNITFNRSIIAGNTAGTAPSNPEVLIDDPSGHANITADNFNLFGVNGDAGVVGFLPGLSDIVPAPGVLLGDILDPILADNGGPTLTHALVAGSPAIDAIPSTEPGCAGVDQRGLSRPQDGDADGVPACDIGAYELEAEEVAFERFDIANARVRLRQRADRDRFNVAGGFRLGAQTDGVDVLNEAVSVTLEGFSETIPPGSFRRVRRREREDEFRGQRFVYDGPSSGIRRLELVIGGVDGRFSIDARRLDLDGLELPATVALTLRIGDDVAQAMIPLNRRGALINRRGEQVADGD